MHNVSIRRHISLTLTPKEWAMYDIAGACRAAHEMNKRVAIAINTADTLAEANRRVRELLRDYSEYGVNDTEGQVVADKLLAIAFNVD